MQECVWGVAYKIPTNQVDKVRDHLNFREKGGYEAVPVVFHPQNTDIEPFKLDIYIGTSDNPFFLGPANIEDIASQIFQSEGPSGKNTEYLFELAAAMKQLVPEVQDKHLYDLEREVLRLSQRNI